MNSKQRIVILAGMVVAVLIGLFPPWDYVYDYTRMGIFGIARIEPAGYHLIFLPPNPPVSYSAKLSIARLLIQWVILGIAVTGTFFLFRDRSSIARKVDIPSLNNAEKLTKPLQGLKLSGIIAVGSFIILVLIGISGHTQIRLNNPTFNLYEILFIALYILLFISILLFEVYLGILARRLNKSLIIWVGLSIITSPLGPYIAYYNMLQEVKNALIFENVKEEDKNTIERDC